MPRKPMMNWEPEKKRWHIMVSGKRYLISCQALGVPLTKEASYQAANDWLLRQLAQEQVDAEKVARQDTEFAAQLDALDAKIDWAANHAPELLPGLQQAKQAALEGSPDQPIVLGVEAMVKRLEGLRLIATGGLEPATLGPEAFHLIAGDERVWSERLRTHARTQADKTVGHQLKRFLAEVKPHQKPATYRELAMSLRRTLGTEVWAAETSVEAIDASTVQRFYGWLLKQDYSPGRHNKVIGFFRRFIGWLEANETIDRAPKNLNLKSHRKKVVHKAIKTYDRVRETVDALSMPYRLWALLALNCSMSNADLGAARWEQIDQKRWTLERRRVKTGDHPDAPTMKYCLWPETIALLKHLPNRTGHLFTTDAGKPLYETRYRPDGTVAVKDLFSTYWQRLAPKPPIPLAKFRSVAASILNKDRLWRSLIPVYQARTPSTIDEKFYAAESDPPLFQALRYLRQQLGYGRLGKRNHAPQKEHLKDS